MFAYIGKLKNDIGVTSILAGQADLKEAAQRCSFDTLRIIASGPMPVAENLLRSIATTCSRRSAGSRPVSVMWKRNSSKT